MCLTFGSTEPPGPWSPEATWTQWRNGTVCRIKMVFFFEKNTGKSWGKMGKSWESVMVISHSNIYEKMISYYRSSYPMNPYDSSLRSSIVFFFFLTDLELWNELGRWISTVKWSCVLPFTIHAMVITFVCGNWWRVGMRLYTYIYIHIYIYIHT